MNDVFFIRLLVNKNFYHKKNSYIRCIFRIKTDFGTFKDLRAFDEKLFIFRF
jgi:hypothetical protein